MRDIGGEWTTQKLDAFQGYLSAYTTALRDQGFSTSYIDVFAGARYCVDDPAEPPVFRGFPDLAGANAKAFLKDSARIALAVNPPFDGYMFIERNRQRCRVLEALSQRFRDRNVHIRSFESNREIQRLCALKWHTRRGLLFVDAYGHQINWNTIVTVARTRAIDLWLLVPLGIGVSRLSMTVGEIPALWRMRLDVLLDGNRWLAGFNRSDAAFDEAIQANTDTLSRCFADRLRTVFPIVTRPGILCSGDRKPLYLLCFASGSAGEHGRMVLKMAHDLLEEVAS